MAEPQRDLPDIASGLECVQGAGVPQCVWRSGLAGNGSNSASCGGAWGESLGETGPRHAGVEGIEGEMPVGAIRSDTEPVAQPGTGLFPQRQDATAAALAQDADVVESRCLEIFRSQANQL